MMKTKDDMKEFLIGGALAICLGTLFKDDLTASALALLVLAIIRYDKSK